MESKHFFKAFATFKQCKPECLLLFSSFFTAQLPNPHSLPFFKKKKKPLCNINGTNITNTGGKTDTYFGPRPFQ